MQDIRKPYRAGKQMTFDRLAVEGRRVKVLRHNKSAQELIRGMKQLTTLYRLGARPDVILIQVR